MKKVDEVDHSVFGTVGPCIQKVHLVFFSLGFNNTALQPSKKERH